jgi:hypothetical protein
MNIDEEIARYRKQFDKHWRNKPESYWLYRLLVEVSELSGSLDGSHHHPVDLELMQIAGICANWLEMRKEKAGTDNDL